MKKDVIRLRPLISDEILEKLSRQDVATVHEAMGQRGAMTHNIRPIRQGMKLCGRALTVKCHAGDNLMLIKAVSMAQKDDVIVADMGPLADNGPFGEVLGVDCQSHGVNGLVVTCGVRDTEALSSMDFPVFSGGVSVFGTSKAVKGTINHPVVVGGVLVHPGDVILGDWDGIAVIPCEEAAEVLRLADMRREKEKGVMERLRRGESLFGIYGYQETFQALGVTEE